MYIDVLQKQKPIPWNKKWRAYKTCNWVVLFSLTGSFSGTKQDLSNSTGGSGRKLHDGRVAIVLIMLQIIQ